MANETTIAALWQSFAKHMPATAGPLQRHEMRVSFYSGASAIFGLLTCQFSDLNQDEACAAMNNLHNEFQQYADELEYMTEQMQQASAQRH